MARELLGTGIPSRRLIRFFKTAGFCFQRTPLAGAHPPWLSGKEPTCRCRGRPPREDLVASLLPARGRAGGPSHCRPTWGSCQPTLTTLQAEPLPSPSPFPGDQTRTGALPSCSLPANLSQVSHPISLAMSKSNQASELTQSSTWL